MNDTIRIAQRPPRRAWPPAARAVAAVAVAAGLALPVGAFGAGPSPSAGSSSARASALSPSTNTEKALAYSRCMRSHGVARFPDPTSGGAVPKVSPAELGVSGAQLAAAQRVCQNLLPAGTGDQFPPGEVQQLLIGMLRFSRCMRAHGVPKWPDPTTDSEGRPIFPLPAAGISRQQARSPAVTRAGNECQHLLPPALPGIPIG